MSICYSVMNIKPNQDRASFDVVVILDPLSKGTNALHLSFIRFVCRQRWQPSPLLQQIARSGKQCNESVLSWLTLILKQLPLTSYNLEILWGSSEHFLSSFKEFLMSLDLNNFGVKRFLHLWHSWYWDSEEGGSMA